MSKKIEVVGVPPKRIDVLDQPQPHVDTDAVAAALGAKPRIKRANTGRFWVHPETRQVYRLYNARVTLNGVTKTFPSEEHAKAWLEDRDPKWAFGMA